MRIQPVGNNKIIVALTRNDMLELDITYDEMDYANMETRRVIWTILDAVREATGKDVDPSGSIIIEAAPDNKGGCLLLFTIGTGKSSTTVSKTNSTYIFEFANIDNLLDALSSAKLETDKIFIFTCQSKYRIELSAELSEKVSRILCEYGFLAGKDIFTVSRTHEHWQRLNCNN